MTRHTVLVTVNSVATFRWQHFTDYHPTENPFILNSDQSEHVLPIFRFWVFQSIQFSGRISKSPKFVLVRIDFFVMTHRGEQKLGWKKGMILCVHMVLFVVRVASWNLNPESKSVEIESRINFLLRWFFVWTFFLFKTDFFQNFFFLEFPLQFHFSQIRIFSQNSPIWFDFSEEARKKYQF